MPSVFVGGRDAHLGWLFGCADKAPGEQLFDTMDANDLNKRLKELMDGLSVTVCGALRTH